MLLEVILKKYGTDFSDLFFINGQFAKIKRNGTLENLTIEQINKNNPFEVDSKFVLKYLLEYYLQKKRGINITHLVEEKTDFDFSIEIKELNISFRCNFFLSRGGWSAVLRIIKNQIPLFKNLGLPSYLVELSDLNSGLVLVTGVTGSGKSTTLASLINIINEKYSKHIITIEDPIEFIYTPKKSLITQREVKIDVEDFPTALKSALREAPNVILVGEMRDKETIEAALKAAETGHLVFSTIHTYNAIQTIERILSYFEGNEQQQVRYSLANTLKTIISQKLLIGRDKKLHLAYEILYNSLSVASNIKEGNLTQVPVTAKNDPLYKKYNVLLNDCLYSMVKKGIITEETALSNSYKKDELEMLLKRR